MIFPFVRVPLPKISCFIQPRNGIRYLFAYVGPRELTKKGKSTHPKAKLIGRVETNANGIDELMPNENYYEIMGKEKPTVAITEGAGCKKEIKDPAVIKQRKETESSQGFGIIATNILAETGTTSSLEKAFGKDEAQQIAAIASFICEDLHSSFVELNDFIKNNKALGCSSTFDTNCAGELLAKISSEQCNEFYGNLINCRNKDATSYLFYDITSFSSNSGQIIKATHSYNHDDEYFRQVNYGLFCSREYSLPIYMCSYDGSINDAQNFKFILQQAKEQHLLNNKHKLTIVMDGGFSRENFNWAHMEGYNLIAGVSLHNLKDIKAQYLVWARTLSLDDFAHEYEVHDSLYISHRVPITFGGVDGELVTYINLSQQADRKITDHSLKKKKEAELKELTHWPGKDFDNWANSFAPYFIVTRANNPKGFSYKENREGQAISNAICGAVCLFTTCHNMSDQEILESYLSKESIETFFDQSRNGLCDPKLSINNVVHVEGRNFLMFAALLLRQSIVLRLKKWMKENEFSFDDVVYELKKIRYTKQKSGSWKPKASPTKVQQEILDTLNLAYFKKEDLKAHPKVHM